MFPNKQARGDSGKEPKLHRWQNGEKTLGETRLSRGASSPLARRTSSLFQLHQSQGVSGPLVPGVFSRWLSKSNQITFIVTSPQHKCLGEWNSYERAPDSAKKNNRQFTYGQTVQKNNKQFTYGQTVQKNNKQFTYGQTVQKNCTGAFTVLQTVQKNNNSNLHMDRQCKKNNSNLHMDRQCKKQQQFTYGQYIFTDCTEDNVQNTHTYTQYA